MAAYAFGFSSYTDDRDWKQQLKHDGKELYDAIVRIHPGIYDERNPDFRPHMDAAFAHLNERAEGATSFWHYNWAMNEFVASFDDGHLSYTYDDKLPKATTRRWPGFLTEERLGKQVVLNRLDDPALPEIGDVLQSCDEVDADRLLADQVGRFVGRWSLRSQHYRYSYRLFYYATNPYFTPMQSCVFQGKSGLKTIPLNWREIAEEDATTRLAALSPTYKAQFDYALTDKTLTLSLKNFDPTPGKETAKTIDAYIGKIEADQQRIQSLDYIVLDLRGNGGGSSHYSRMIARAIWGEAALNAVPRKPFYVEWRPSDEKINIMDKYMWLAGLMGHDKETVEYWKAILKGLKEARAAGLPLWRETVTTTSDSSGPSSYATPNPFKGSVYILTDHTCASACLDAVDLWKNLGGIQVGRETSGDTVYMDLAEVKMSDFAAKAYLPSKVFRDRPRGNNESHSPKYVFEGDLTNTPAVMEWIKGLPR
ncbi:S41 family peptidase [Burkholderiaceae bacterium DAT-1]|nr:S41 family peptidase [Burkholderiaceae bacterium DAT-1]